MKTKSFFPIAALTLSLSACSFTPKNQTTTEVVSMLPADAPGTALTQDEAALVRTPEHLKNYRVNPYRDPNNPSMRHDGHDVQRVEQEADWNMRPNPPLTVTGGPSPAQPDPALTVNPVKAELEQELVKQQKYTQLIIEQNESLTRQNEVMLKQSEEYKQLREQNTRLAQEVEKLKSRQAAEDKAKADAAKAAANKKWWQWGSGTTTQNNQ